MKKFVEEHYLEPGKISTNHEYQEAYDNFE